jgi:hypothetical protein
MPSTNFTEQQFAIAKTYLSKFQSASKKDRATVIRQAANAVVGLDPQLREKDKKELTKAN